MRIHAGRIARRRLRHRAGIYYYRRNRRNRRRNTITFGMVVWAIIAVVFIVAIVSTI